MSSIRQPRPGTRGRGWLALAAVTAATITLAVPAHASTVYVQRAYTLTNDTNTGKTGLVGVTQSFIPATSTVLIDYDLKCAPTANLPRRVFAEWDAQVQVKNPNTGQYEKLSGFYLQCASDDNLPHEVSGTKTFTAKPGHHYRIAGRYDASQHYAFFLEGGASTASMQFTVHD